MKTKDIITVLAAIILIGGSCYLGYRMLAPAQKAKTAEETATVQPDRFTGNIDEDTLKMISERKDYGEATLDNIGRTNPFGPLN